LAGTEVSDFSYHREAFIRSIAMVLLGGSMLIVGLLALGGLAHAQTNVPKPNTTSQQPSGTVPSSQTEAQGQPGQEIQEEPVDSTQDSKQGDPQKGQQPVTGGSVK
jgi:hypothetical protein